MRIFRKKVVKSPQRPGAPPLNSHWPPAAEDSAPRLLRCYFHLLIYIYRSMFLVLKLFDYFEK